MQCGVDPPEFWSNAAVLAWRIRIENQALAWAMRADAAAEALTPASLANETPKR
jgi:hypothetical protein